MENYNYGIHYDASLGGLATAVNGKKANGNKYATEFHVSLNGTSNLDKQYLLQRYPVSPQSATYFSVAENALVSSSNEFVLPPITGDFVRIRFERDADGGTLNGFIDTGSGVLQPIDFNGYLGGVVNELNFFAGFNTSCKFGLILLQRDTGSGWEDFARVDPNRVPSVGGGYTFRGAGDAVPESTNRIYDTTDGSYFTLENNDVAGTFPAIYNIVSINGETETPTVEIGSPIVVEMSDEITPDAITLDDGNKTYEFIFTTEGKVSTLEFPLTSDDTLPKFGEVTISVIKGADTFTKTVTFQEPSGYTRVDLANPIELDESSYTFGTGLTPIATDVYFYQPTTDFNITEKNVLEPQGDAPWQHTVWYLSGAGLYRTTLNSGYGVIVGTPPVANAGNDQVGIEAGALVQLDSSASTDDNAIVSRVWTQTAGDTVTLSDDTAVSPTFTAPTTNADQTLTFSVLVTDGDSATDSDSVNIGVLAEVVTPPDPDSTLTLEVDGIGSGLRSVVIHDRSTRDVLFDGQMTFSNDVGSVTLTDVPAGTEVYGAYFGVDPENDGTGLYGSTE